MLQDRFIYVFGGFRTLNFKKPLIIRVTKNVEETDNVTSNYIEKYDTFNDLEDEKDARMSKIQNQRYKVSGFNFTEYHNSSSSEPEGKAFKQYKYFERIHIKRDNINNVGNLICFPMLPDCASAIEDKILIVGGLNIGLLSSKSHIYDASR